MSQAFLNLQAKIGSTVSIGALKEHYSEMPKAYQNVVEEDVFVKYFLSGKRDTFLWHDYEAGGKHAPSVTPLQFAGVRTTLDLEIIDVPIDIYCKLDWDRLPHPEAIAITKINPITCLEKGVEEPVFFRNIEKEMAVPKTCTVGYNSMRYDEGVSRFGFWRTLIPVYEREYKNGNSRWDLLPVMAAYASLAVPGIKIPTLEDGKKSLKLENLATANNISQENAHNAVDDVYALIGLAKLLKESSSPLWDYCFESRVKKNAAGRCAEASTGILFSVMMGSENNYSKPIVFLGASPRNKNSERVYLAIDDQPSVRKLWHQSAEEIKSALFSKKEELEESGVERPPLGAVKTNEGPVFIPFSWLQRHDFNVEDDSGLFAEKVMMQNSFIEKLLHVYSASEMESASDPELALYGGFPIKEDAFLIQQIRNCSIEEGFAEGVGQFYDENLKTIFEHARARLRTNEAVTLSADELYNWKKYCAHRQWRQIEEGDKTNDLNLTNVDEVLESVEMETELKEGYKRYLTWVKENLA